MIDPRGLRARARVLRAMRDWFDQQGYLEVPSPVLVPSPAMEPTLVALEAADGYLRTSPEFALKRVVASGLGRVYEIGSCFRDDEHGRWHRREFLMCEWYRVGGHLDDLQQEVEDLVGVCADALERPRPTFQRWTVQQAFEHATGLNPFACRAQELSPEDATWDDAFFRRWVADVEPALPPAVFLRDWPASQAALARVVQTPAGLRAQRFEAYLNGIELANAFDELRDGAEQRQRCVESRAVQERQGQRPHPIDEAFLDAVDRLPKAVGIALGVDRLVATLMGWDNIGPGRV